MNGAKPHHISSKMVTISTAAESVLQCICYRSFVWLILVICNILHHHRYMSANQFSVDAGQKTKLALESIAFYAHFSSRNYTNETFYSRKGQCSALFGLAMCCLLSVLSAYSAHVILFYWLLRVNYPTFPWIKHEFSMLPRYSSLRVNRLIRSVHASHIRIGLDLFGLCMWPVWVVTSRLRMLTLLARLLLRALTLFSKASII